VFSVAFATENTTTHWRRRKKMITPITAGVTLVVALLVFGPKNLPELAKGAGKALGEFKKAVNDVHEPLKSNLDPLPLETPTLAAAPIAGIPNA
jgi:TatA/E family protein of Tat protein translocase